MLASKLLTFRDLAESILHVEVARPCYVLRAIESHIHSLLVE